MKPKFKTTRRKGVLGIYDNGTKNWKELSRDRDGVYWCGFGLNDDVEGYLRYLNAKYFRSQFVAIHGNQWAIRLERRNRLTVITGGAA